MSHEEKKEECNLVLHAISELRLLEEQAATDEDPSALKMQKHVTEDVLNVLRVISAQGHSGGSIGYVMGLVKRLAFFGNLTPLKGTDEEWMEVGDGMFQSVRCPHVFKNADGRAYDLDGYIGVDPNGSCWTGGGTPTCYIEFPYTPKSRYMPRLSLIPEVALLKPEFQNFEAYLMDTKEAVLDFYKRNGIEQPPEEEHVVKLHGRLDYTAVLSPSEGAPVAEPVAPIEDEPEPKL